MRDRQPDVAKAATATGHGRQRARKDHIFRAAMRVALGQGFGKVTLNAVAREAGISKGGLLYHFSTKNDLIRAMLTHHAGCEARAPRDRERWPAEPAREADPLAVAALIAAAEDPSLLEPIARYLDLHACESSARSVSSSNPHALAGALARSVRFNHSRD